MWVSRLLRLVVLGYITKSMVLVSPSVKICDFLLLLFHYWRVGVVSEKRKKKKKEKKDTEHWNPASRTCSGV